MDPLIMERTEGVFTRRPTAPVKMFDNGVLQQDQLHVLAVDDSLVDRKVIERLLKISSCKVTTVDSGWSALQYLGLDGNQHNNNNSVSLDGLKVNLIITDYWMPGMTGYELLKKIKECSALKEIPVVIMSSENVLPRINRCLEEGAEEFIVKPVKLSDVKRLKNYYTSKDEEPEPELVQVEKQAEPELVEVEEEKGTNKRKFQDTELEMEVEGEDGEKVLNGTDFCISGSSLPASSLLTSSGSLSPLTSGASSPSNSPSRRLKTSNGSN